MSDFIVEVKNISRQFGNNLANNNISLQIPKGSIYGILGPNGAGKTTLIRMITTISRPDSGEILFNGEALNENHAMKMGYMPEERGLYKKMKVIDQLVFFAEIKGISKKESVQKAEYWINKLEIASWRNKKLEELSKGMAQKIQFICTIMHEPELIILDEPFSGFDPVNADLVKNEILALKEKGSTILFSTHRMDNVEELCDYLCIIHKGEKVLDGKAGLMRREKYLGDYRIGFLQEVNTENSPFQINFKEKTADGRYIYHIPANDYKTDQILAEIVKLGTPVYFEEALPSIHEIFVQTVNQN